ncbi:MAG: hypothetical protein WCP35_22095, partial [Verrucomicrobiota bacterium]
MKSKLRPSALLSLASRLLAIAPVFLALALPAAADTQTSSNTQNPPPAPCCDCLSIVPKQQSDEPDSKAASVQRSTDGSITVEVTVTHNGGANCPPFITGTVAAKSANNGTECADSPKTFTLATGQSTTLYFKFTPDEIRQSQTWEFVPSCEGLSECQQHYPFTLTSCSSCDVCQASGDPDSYQSSFTAIIPTTSSNGGMTKGSLRFHTADFSFPGRAGLSAIVPSNFIVWRAQNLITKVETGAATLEIADVPNQSAFTITYKDPFAAVFRTTTISFVNEDGVQRLRMDTTYEGTTIRHEQTQPLADTLVLKKGRVINGAFAPLWQETLVKSETVPGIRILHRTVEERATASATFAPTSDTETTWEKQVYGWVETKEIIDPAGAALTSTWSYYQPGEITGPGGSAMGLGRLKRHVRHDGYESFHTYSLYYHSVTTPFGGNVAGQTTTAIWSAVEKSRTVTTTVGAKVLSKSVRAYGPSRTVDTVYTSSDKSLVTTTDYVPSGLDFGGMPVRVQRPDGTLATYSYHLDDTTKGVTTVMDQGATDDGRSVSLGMRTTTVTNSRGTTILRKTQAIGYGPADIPVFDCMAVTSVDNLGRATITAWQPASVTILGEKTSASGQQWSTSVNYSCCGVADETDRDG